MYVIVKTTNDERGYDAILSVYGAYDDARLASEVCQEMRAELPDGYASHEEYPVDYVVMAVCDAC